MYRIIPIEELESPYGSKLNSKTSNIELMLIEKDNPKVVNNGLNIC